MNPSQQQNLTEEIAELQSALKGLREDRAQQSDIDFVQKQIDTLQAAAQRQGAASLAPTPRTTPVFNPYPDLVKQIEYVKEQVRIFESFEGDSVEEELRISKAILQTLEGTRWMIDGMTQQLLNIPGNKPGERDPIDELTNALVESRDLIKSWHNLAGVAEGQDDTLQNTWNIYTTKAPEMANINAVIEKYAGKEVERDN